MVESEDKGKAAKESEKSNGRPKAGGVQRGAVDRARGEGGEHIMQHEAK